MQSEAIAVAKAWGFTIKSELVWRKLTANGKRHFGMGRYVRLEHEVCLIGARGRATSLIENHSTRSVFDAPVGVHSAKPDAFYQLVEGLAPSSVKFEIFARKRRAGWVQFGDQLGAL
jgi:N6-adenosine-specific RNA methylase IME4